MKKTLVVLAAGMGSRYGGLKQLDPLGPSGEAILEYSVFDALRAGFQKIVFIIRRDFADAFKETVGTKFDSLAEIAYCYQELDHLPAGFKVPADREKPWGTGHALLATMDTVREPFLIINADDLYGTESFKLASQMLDSWEQTTDPKCAIIGFRLDQTLSENGTVSRGICEISDSAALLNVTETHEIIRKKDQIVAANKQVLDDDATASMNMWCMTPSLFREFDTAFIQFLTKHLNTRKSEFYIPGVVDKLIKAGKIECAVAQSPAKWFGVTYQEDRNSVVASLKQAVDAGIYPANLHG